MRERASEGEDEGRGSSDVVRIAEGSHSELFTDDWNCHCWDIRNPMWRISNLRNGDRVWWLDRVRGKWRAVDELRWKGVECGTHVFVFFVVVEIEVVFVVVVVVVMVEDDRLLRKLWLKSNQNQNKPSLATTIESEKFSSFQVSHSDSAKTTLMQHNDPWSLYAQTAVRLKYYASDRYSESYELASFIKDGRITFLSPFY